MEGVLSKLTRQTITHLIPFTRRQWNWKKSRLPTQPPPRHPLQRLQITTWKRRCWLWEQFFWLGCKFGNVNGCVWGTYSRPPQQNSLAEVCFVRNEMACPAAGDGQVENVFLMSLNISVLIRNQEGSHLRRLMGKSWVSLQYLFYLSQVKGANSALGPRWPGHYFCQFEKRLPQPEIKSTCRIHLEIRFNPA